MHIRKKIRNFTTLKHYNTNKTYRHMANFLMLPLFLGNLKGWEWLIIGLVVLLLFGGKKIPELMRGIGKGINSFKQGLREAKEEINKEENNTDKK